MDFLLQCVRFLSVTSNVCRYICRATGMEEGPKVTLDIQCLQRGGEAALTLMYNYFLH